MADTTRNIFTLGEYRDDQTAGKGITVTDVWTDLFPTGAVEININTQNDNRMDLGNTSQGSYIYVKQPAAATSEWDLGTGDWSFECWCKAKSIYTAGHYKRIWELGWSTSNSLCLNVRMDGTLEFRYNDTPYLNSSAGAFTIGEWHHVLVHRVSGSIRLFLDGVWQQTESLSGNLNYMTGSAISKLIIGANNGQPTTSWWNGWISNFRFLKGSASHTSSSNFVPPIPPLQNITNTKVLCCQDPDDPAGWTVVPVNYSGDQEINLYGLQQSGSNANQVGTQIASLQYVGLAKRWLGDKTETSNMGYVFGGSTPSSFTNMMRLDMSTNTTSFFPGSENSYSSRSNHAATASQTTGYVAGGEPSTNAVGQFNFSNETSSGSSPMQLVGPRTSSVGHGNITHGYILGGGPGNPGYTNTTKLDYASNTSSNLGPTANLRASVPGSDQYTKDMNNTGNQEQGYTIGGNPGSSYIDKFIYATDTVSSSVSSVIPAGSPSSLRKPSYAAKGTALADGTYGYMIGNNYSNDPSNSIVGNWFRITFASDTEAFMPSWYPSGASGGGKFGNTTKGYTMGGGDNSQRSNRVLEFDYATGTGTGVPGSVPASINQTTGMSVRNSNAPIYFPPTVSTTPSVKLVDADYGIYQARDKSTFDKRDFSTDGVSLIPSLAFPGNSSPTVAVANQDAIWTYQSPSRGGYKIPWASQTRVTQPNSWFPMDHWYHLGEGSDAFNSSTSGYFAGGNSGTFNPAGNYAYTSEVYKIDFSTGTGYTPGRNREETNAWAANAQSDSQGYSFGGERNPSPGSHNKVVAMRFADENWNELPSTGFPSHQSSQSSGTGTKTHAYIGGGYQNSGQGNSRSYMWKMSFSTDTGSRLPSANLPGWPSGGSTWRVLTATGDQEKGYWAGGGPSEGGTGKLVYASDTMSGASQYNNRNSRSYAISNADFSRTGKIGTNIEVL